MRTSNKVKFKAATLFIGCLLLFAPLTFAGGYGQGVTAHVVKKADQTADGKKVAFPQTENAEVTVATVTIAPGAETGWHKHPNPVYAYVISGSLAVELEDGLKMSYDKGDAIIEVVNLLHNGSNLGTEPVELVVVYLGSKGEPLTVKESPAAGAKP